MEMLTLKQIKELQEHRAIPYGAGKLFFGTSAILTWLFGGAWGLLGLFRSAHSGQEPKLSMMLLVLFGLIITFGLYLSYYIEHTSLHHRPRGDLWPFGWLREYWRRNVRGYVVRFSYARRHGDHGQAELEYIIKTPLAARGTTHISDGAHPFAIELSLGGWFTRERFVSEDSEILRYLSGWSVRFWHIADVGLVEVRLRDPKGNAAVLSIEEAFTMLERALLPARVGAISDWSDLMCATTRHLERAREDLRQDQATINGLTQFLSELFDQLRAAVGSPPFDPERPLLERIAEEMRHLIAERGAARGEVDRYANGFLPAAIADGDTARRERDEAVAFIESVMADIAGSSRLTQAIEGLRLLERCVNWLCGRAVPDSPEHRALQDRLALVREKLAEKQKRDRRRHRNRPAEPHAPTSP